VCWMCEKAKERDELIRHTITSQIVCTFCYSNWEVGHESILWMKEPTANLWSWYKEVGKSKSPEPYKPYIAKKHYYFFMDFSFLLKISEKFLNRSQQFERICSVPHGGRNRQERMESILEMFGLELDSHARCAHDWIENPYCTRRVVDVLVSRHLFGRFA